LIYNRFRKGRKQMPRKPKTNEARETKIAQTNVLVEDDPNDPDFNPPPTYEGLGLDQDFADQARQYAEFAAKIKVLEAARREAGEILSAYLGAAEVKTVMVEHLRVTLADGRVTKTLRPAKLIELGVPADLITKATEVREGEPYVVITDTAKGR
jgi:hypothetical protein